MKNDISFIKYWIDFACERNKIKKIAKNIKIEFNKRFTARFADADHLKKLIRFSDPLWPVAKQKQKRDIIIHETCHIISGEKYGEDIFPHGKEWQKAMKKCGLKPQIYHDVNNMMLQRNNKIECNCSQHKVSKQIVKAIQNNFKMFCLRCGNIYKTKE